MFYYKDLDINKKISDWLIPMIILLIIINPILIYSRIFTPSIVISLILATFQLICIAKNIRII